MARLKRQKIRSVISTRLLNVAMFAVGLLVTSPLGLTRMVVISSCWLDLELIIRPQLGGTASAGLFAGARRAMPDFALALLALHRTADHLGTRLRLRTAILARLPTPRSHCWHTGAAPPFGRRRRISFGWQRR